MSHNDLFYDHYVLRGTMEDKQQQQSLEEFRKTVEQHIALCLESINAKDQEIAQLKLEVAAIKEIISSAGIGGLK